MSTERLLRILVLLGLVIVTFGILAASIVADEAALPAGLTALALGAITVGADILVICIQSAADKRSKGSSTEVREPQRFFRTALTSFRRSGVITVLLGLAIVLFLGDQVARVLAPLLGPGFLVAWLTDIALSWFLWTKHYVYVRQ